MIHALLLVALVQTPVQQVSFDLEEGTWMNVALSPDGTTLAFDWLGDIYTMPATGGEARAVCTGTAWQMQPAFSPDGAQLAYTSDEGGGDNIWVCSLDGSNARAVTKETFRLLTQPAWSPDGEWLLARKHYTRGQPYCGPRLLHAMCKFCACNLAKRSRCSMVRAESLKP